MARKLGWLSSRIKGLPPFSRESGIALKHARRRIARIDGEIVLAFGKDGARDQPDEVDGVWHASDFIEIIDAPDEPTFGIAPRPEVLDMEITHGQHRRRLGETRADLQPQRDPPIEGPAQKGEGRASHVLVLRLEVRIDDIEALTGANAHNRWWLR